jgi:two-component sensor histidine kinase
VSYHALLVKAREPYGLPAEWACSQSTVSLNDTYGQAASYAGRILKGEKPGAIISYQLREQPRLRDDIIAGLVALSATDDLIMTAQGRGASIRAILSTELKPYGLARISMEGPDIILTPTLALTLALIVHELATNAAKYGALSVPAGKLSIQWSLADRILNLDWRETGGPVVVSPTHRGFGLKLLSRAFEQFGGNVEMTFETNGLVCQMKALLPDSTASIVPDDQPSSPAAA